MTAGIDAAQTHQYQFANVYTYRGRKKHLKESHGFEALLAHYYSHQLSPLHLPSFKRSPKMTKAFEIVFDDTARIETGVVSQTAEMPEQVYFALTDRTGSAAVVEMTQGEASRLQHILKMTLDVLMTERSNARAAKRSAGFQRIDQ